MLRSLMVLAGFGSSTKRRMVSILALALAWVGSFAVRIAPIDEIFQGLGFPKDYQEFVKKFCGLDNFLKLSTNSHIWTIDWFKIYSESNDISSESPYFNFEGHGLGFIMGVPNPFLQNYIDFEVWSSYKIPFGNSASPRLRVLLHHRKA